MMQDMGHETWDMRHDGAMQVLEAVKTDPEKMQEALDRMQDLQNRADALKVHSECIAASFLCESASVTACMLSSSGSIIASRLQTCAVFARNYFMRAPVAIFVLLIDMLIMT